MFSPCPIRRVQIFFPSKITNSTPQIKPPRTTVRTAARTTRRKNSISNRLFSESIHSVTPPSVSYTSHGRRRPPQPKFLIRPPEPKFIEKFSSLKRSVENGTHVDEICPICKERLGAENVCILSCGHLVHKTCLNSFKKLVNEKTPRCPVCHTIYKIVDIQIDINTLNKSAVKIQRIVRGYLVRRHIDELAPFGSIMHRKWVLRQAENASARLTSVIDRQNENVDIVLSSIDEQLEWARSVMKAVDARGMKVDWAEIRRQARERKGPCAICLREIDEDKAVVTSCGHVFHEDCLESWMQYCSKEQKQASCPECRSFFQVRPLKESRILEMELY